MEICNARLKRCFCREENLKRRIAELENDLFLLKFALRQIRDDRKMPEPARKAADNALKVVEG